ncbi:hypothetical protein [Kocuria rosea]|uniref:DUF998 domain-containing protein n=1 Tax=Kocuria rosea subsp. polaris TaxID=136273 RepID=A0A0A6VR82_KOCRO|nr:hypothetical protein [Kocuria polaris]KHD97525.1 hypothetical protein GY22_09340 [Kocuria polaris]
MPEVKASSTRLWRKLAVTVLTLDALILAATALHLLANRLRARDAWWAVFDSRDAWSGRLDGSVAETFGNLQLIAAGVVLLLSAFRGRQLLVLGAWGTVFFLVAADDFLRLHQVVPVPSSAFESSGILLSAVQVETVQKVLFWAAMALVLGVGMLIAHFRASRHARRASWALLAAATTLGVFAGGVDFLSTFVHGPHGGTLYSLVTYVETTGELLSMSLIFIVALAIASGQPGLGPITKG